MKRMEVEITLTFAIMIVVGVAINGMDSFISQSIFFTFEVLARGLLTALMYLGYIWINTRRHQLLTYIGILGIGFMALFALFSVEGIAGTFSSLNWKDIVMFIIIHNIIPNSSLPKQRTFERRPDHKYQGLHV